jgi:hypothetical protein
MGLAGMLSKGIGMAIKHAPRVVKTFGQISEGAKKFGNVIDAGRKFGSVVNQATNGKIANSKFGRDISSLTDKASQLTNKVASEATETGNLISSTASKLS